MFPAVGTPGTQNAPPTDPQEELARFTGYDAGTYTYLDEDGYKQKFTSAQLYHNFDSMEGIVDPSKTFRTVFPNTAVESLRILALKNNDLALSQLIAKLLAAYPRLDIDAYPESAVDTSPFYQLSTEERERTQRAFSDLYSIVRAHRKLPLGLARERNMVSLSNRLVTISRTLPWSISSSYAVSYGKDGRAYAVPETLATLITEMINTLPSERTMQIVLQSCYYFLLKIYEVLVPGSDELL